MENEFKTPHIGYQNVVSFTCSDDAIEPLIELFNKLKSLGQMGSSREISIGWDGDGRDRLEHIAVNGLTLDAWKIEMKRLDNSEIDVRNDDIIECGENEC